MSIINKIIKRTKDIIWEIKYRVIPKHRYHVIKTGLPPGWHDRDDVLISTIFKILVDFVEEENPFEHFDTEESLDKDNWVKVKELYNWVKNDWPKIKENGHWSDYYELETQKAIEIVELRKMYWT